jgi:hypothetical protein
MRAGEPSLIEDESECDSTQPAVIEQTAQKQGPPLGRPSFYIIFVFCPSVLCGYF